MNESELTRDIVKRLNLIPNCFAFRVHGGPHQAKGTLDITGCFRGQFFAIEMKMPGKQRNLTEIQAATIRKVEKARGRVGVATCWDEALAILGLKESTRW